MNREIKFRGKPCYKGVKTWPWIYGTFQYIAQRRVNPGGTDNGTLVPRVDKGRIVDLYGNETEVLCDTVGQFTGLYDKNGKEIYEGDIIKVIDCAKVVKYINEICSFCFGNIETLKEPVFAKWGDLYNYHQINGTYLEEYKNEIEVIGNVHDNPELLK